MIIFLALGYYCYVFRLLSVFVNMAMSFRKKGQAINSSWPWVIYVCFVRIMIGFSSRFGLRIKILWLLYVFSSLCNI